jgi:hypothetical protein
MRYTSIHADIRAPPVDANFCDEYGNAIKPAAVADYNRHIEYVGKADTMTNSYYLCRRTWKWTRKLFFHLLDDSEELHLVV